MIFTRLQNHEFVRMLKYEEPSKSNSQIFHSLQFCK